MGNKIPHLTCFIKAVFNFDPLWLVCLLTLIYSNMSLVFTSKDGLSPTCLQSINRYSL